MYRVVHFEIHASDPQVLVDFYTRLFGWKMSRWADQPYWTIETGEATAPGINGGLLQRRGSRPAEGQAVNCYVCTVEVENVDAKVEEAASEGGSIAVAKAPIPGIGWLAYIKDPDGNLVGLLQSDPAAR
jgi:predicted enzyme related to lactoylglutathione lyase